MQVGAIGGGAAMGAGAAGVNAAAAGTSATAGTTAQAGGGVAESATIDSQAAKPWESVAEMGLQALGDSVKDFNSIDLLIALLLMAAMQGKDDDESSCGSAAAGFLAGLALSGQLGQGPEHDLQSPVPEVSGGEVGGNINLTA